MTRFTTTLPLRCKVLSLDLWDTILRRRCHPDEVKIFTMQRMLFLLGLHQKNFPTTPLDLLHFRQKIEYRLGKIRKQKGLDDEYEIEEVLDECIIQLTDNTLPYIKKEQLRKDLVQTEIEQEIFVSFLDNNLLQLLKQCQFEKIIVVSDFYMSYAKIMRILKSKGFPYPIWQYFISCDNEKNKKSGRLFQHVLDQINTSPQSILHIGDNTEADIRMAANAGLRTYLFTKSTHHKTRLDNDKFFRTRCNSSRATKLKFQQNLTVNRSIVSLLSIRNNLLGEGKLLSFIFCGFALYIQQFCCQHHHRKIFFFTREGIFFKKVFDIFQQNNPFNLPQVETVLLPVSRLSTFFPSLREISCEELMRLWSMYSTQSMHDLFSSLGLTINDKYLSYLARYSIKPTESIDQPWEDKRVIQLFKDSDFANMLYKEQARKKKNIYLFFKSLGFGDNANALIVDIGWRGSIQDNLAYLFPNVSIDGLYIGLQTFFNPQPPNTKKYAYIANAQNGDNHSMLSRVIPLEMLCYGPGGSTVGYEKKGSSNRNNIQPVYDNDDGHFYHQWIAPFQRGVIEQTKPLCQHIRLHGIGLNEMREISSDMITRLIHDPSPEIYKAFLSLQQDDTFGRNRVIIPGRTKLKLSDKILGYFFPIRKEPFLKVLENSVWPEVLLRHQYCGLFYLISKARKIISMTFR